MPEAGPEPGAYAQSLNGYELPIAMEVRRGRFNQSYETPHALVPNTPTEWTIPLREHDHVFLKGHRIMVQVQSTWFPADRPQSAEVRAEHLRGESERLREGDAARVRHPGASVAHHAARRALSSAAGCIGVALTGGPARPSNPRGALPMDRSAPHAALGSRTMPPQSPPETTATTRRRAGQSDSPRTAASRSTA